MYKPKLSSRYDKPPQWLIDAKFKDAVHRGRIALNAVVYLRLHGTQLEKDVDSCQRSLAVRHDISIRRVLAPANAPAITRLVVQKAETLRERRAHFWQ